MKVLLYRAEGVLPDGCLAGITITALTGTPAHVREADERMVREELERSCPGIRDIRTALDWVEYDMPDLDEDDL